MRLKFNPNHLTVRTFSVFWFAFLAMTAILVALPYFDGRSYADLSESEVSFYQKKLLESIRSNKIKGIISGVPVLPGDRFDTARPVLMDSQRHKVLGAFGNENEAIKRFAENTDGFSPAKRKNFRDLQIVGPFPVYIDDSEEPYSLFFVSYVNSQQEILRYMLDNPLLLLLMALLVTTPLLWWFTHTIVKPITRLQKAANSVAAGNFKVDNQLATQGPVELREVGRSFNNMAAAMDNLISNHHNLLSSISHELKTPLTRLQLSTALLRHQNGETEPLKRIEKEIGRMDKMISELLLLSRQQMDSRIQHEIFSLDQIWHDVVKDAQFESEQQHIRFNVTIQIAHPEQLLVYGNLSQLTSATENIVRNALKYTKDTIALSIYLLEQGDTEYVQIRVDDNGSGLSEVEFEKIFKPFYRVDETRTRSTGGTGLGLAIVANVIAEHQGKVWAEHSNLGGLAVTIQLPLWH